MVLRFSTVKPAFPLSGKKLGYTFNNRNFHNVSLGQGQEIVAEQALDLAATEGHWVILQVFDLFVVLKTTTCLELLLKHVQSLVTENWLCVSREIFPWFLKPLSPHVSDLPIISVP